MAEFAGLAFAELLLEEGSTRRNTCSRRELMRFQLLGVVVLSFATGLLLAYLAGGLHWHQEAFATMFAQPVIWRCGHGHSRAAWPSFQYLRPSWTWLCMRPAMGTEPLQTPPARGLSVSSSHGRITMGASSASSDTSQMANGEVPRVPVNSPQDDMKRLAGYRAVDDYVRSGTVIGLGTGSTAAFAVERVGDKLASGELTDILAVPTSLRTTYQATALGIPLTTLDAHADLDVAIDGADEVDPQFNLVKGGGGALLREKMVEVMAKKFIVIVDETKLVKNIGPGFPIPVEIVQFCHVNTMREIVALPALAGNCEPVLRRGSVSTNKMDGENPALTDNGNYIVDLCCKEPIKDVRAAAVQLKSLDGVVNHGLFVDMTTAVIVAGKSGVEVRTM